MPMLNNQMVVGNKEPKVPVKPLAFAVENGCLPLSPLLASKGESHRQLAYGFLWPFRANCHFATASELQTLHKKTARKQPLLAEISDVSFLVGLRLGRISGFGTSLGPCSAQISSGPFSFVFLNRLRKRWFHRPGGYGWTCPRCLKMMCVDFVSLGVVQWKSWCCAKFVSQFHFFSLFFCALAIKYGYFSPKKVLLF